MSAKLEVWTKQKKRLDTQLEMNAALDAAFFGVEGMKKLDRELTKMEKEMIDRTTIPFPNGVDKDPRPLPEKIEAVQKATDATIKETTSAREAGSALLKSVEETRKIQADFYEEATKFTSQLLLLVATLSLLPNLLNVKGPGGCRVKVGGFGNQRIDSIKAKSTLHPGNPAASTKSSPRRSPGSSPRL